MGTAVIFGLGIWYLLSGKKEEARRPDTEYKPVGPVAPPATTSPSTSTNTKPAVSSDYNPATDKDDGFYQTIADSYGIPWQALKAFAAVESNYGNADWAVNKTPYYTKLGMMGISTASFQWVASMIGKGWSLSDAWNPAVSIEACAYINKLNAKGINGYANYWQAIKAAISDKRDFTANEDYYLGRIVGAYNVGPGNLSNPDYTAKWQSYYARWKTALTAIIARQGSGTVPPNPNQVQA